MEVAMKVRRVVTGHNDGKSVIRSDGTPPRAKDFVHTPSFFSALVWTTPVRPSISFDGKDPTESVASFIPTLGETRFIIVTFPPDSVMASADFDPVAAIREQSEESPGLVQCFEPDNPGMHTTPTVDYGIVLDGEIWLELDDGNMTHLKRHDVIIQNRTRHAWRNKGTVPATLAFILIGAQEQ
jgi:quercetin dioxygenase-like cupin family protein